MAQAIKRVEKDVRALEVTQHADEHEVDSTGIGFDGLEFLGMKTVVHQHGRFGGGAHLCGEMVGFVPADEGERVGQA